MSEGFFGPGEPGNYLVNEMSLGEGSVLDMEGGDAEAVTWLGLQARATDHAENTDHRYYAFTDEQLLYVIDMLSTQAKRRGLLPEPPISGP